MRLTTLATTALLLALTACQKAAEIQEATVPQERWFADVDLPAYLDCAREQGVTLLQAHRAGDRPGSAENSLAAIEASLSDGALFIEMDVALSADGRLVLMHDRRVDRTTTGSGPVNALTYDELQALELVDENGRRTGEGVPTFAAALAALDGRGIAQVDLKEEVSLEQIAVALEAADAVHRAVVITYSLEDAILLHRRLPTVSLSAGMNSLQALSDLDRAGVERRRITAWLGLGSGKPELDASLAAEGIETSFGDFRAEREGSVDYRIMAANGAEVISVDNVPAAASALNAASEARALLASCKLARSAAGA